MEQIGPYRLIKELGRGSLGVVYRARHIEEDREYALKVIPSRTLATRGDAAVLMKRLRREAQAARKTGDHPNIVGVRETGEFDDRLFVAMDLVKGRPMDIALNEDIPTPVQIARWGFELARALAHAHRSGVLHRDVKPANVMVEVNGRAMLTDFGLPSITKAEGAVAKLVQSDEVIGTPAYLAPESVSGEPPGYAGDLYALGATLYECFAGRPPFTGESVQEILTAVTTTDPIRLGHVASRTPEPLERVIHRCLARDPAHRYPSADALGDDLERFLDGEPVQATRESVRRFARSGKNSARVILLMLLTLALAGVTVAAWLFLRAP